MPPIIRWVPLRATAVDIIKTHGPQKRKPTIWSVSTPDRLFGGRAHNWTVARNYYIRRTAALQGKNNGLPWANQTISKWFSQLDCFFPLWLSPDLLWQCSGRMCFAFLRHLESKDIWSRASIYCLCMTTEFDSPPCQHYLPQSITSQFNAQVIDLKKEKQLFKCVIEPTGQCRS